MRRTAGQSALLMAISLSLLLGIGIASLQALGFGMRTFQLHQAATVAAQTMAHGLRVGNPSMTPCWEAGDGLQRPAAYSEAEVCRAVIANLGTLDVRQATVRVTGQGLDGNGQPVSYRVTIRYREPVTSPVLRLLVGASFTSTAEATSTAS